MYRFLINLFRKKRKVSNIQTVENSKNTDRTNVIEPDFIDYDGMGNFGRFPPIEKKGK